MSYLRFSPAENAKVQKAAKAISAVRAFEQHGRARFKRRTRLADKRASEDGYTTDDVGDFIRSETQVSDDIKSIPGVTTSLQTVLRQLNIDTIAQLLSKFLAYIDGINDTSEVCQAFYTWLKDSTKGTTAANTNLHTVVDAMAQLATTKGLFEYYNY